MGHPNKLGGSTQGSRETADGSASEEDRWMCEFTRESISRQRMKGAEGLIAVYGLRLDCPLRGANRPRRYSEGGGGETLAAAGG